MKGLDLKINQIVIYYVDTKISTEYSATNISFFVYVSKNKRGFGSSMNKQSKTRQGKKYEHQTTAIFYFTQNEVYELIG